MVKDSERINYIIHNGQYIGKSVNFPLIGQFDSLDELKSGMKKLMGHFVNDINEMMKNKEPLNFVEVEEFPI